MTLQPHPNRHPGITYADVQAELARELSHREATYPGMVAKGSMTRGDAHRQVELFRAIAADAVRFEGAARIRYSRPTPAPGHGFTWHERREALQRELAMRDRIYPAWVAKGSLTRATAALQCQRLQAMLDLYEDGLDYPRGPIDHPGAGPDIYQTFLPIAVERGQVDLATAKAFVASLAGDQEQAA